jgi:AGZA family xanthine/uracil permease-like MFS transporter
MSTKWSNAMDSLNKAVAQSPVGYYFKLEGSNHPLERPGSLFTRELRAGLVTFAAMAYIISVNASILSDTGGPCVAKVGTANEAEYATCKEQVRQDYVTATSAISFIATFLMGLLANLPLGLAPGLGVNAYFAYTVVGFDGTGLIPYGQALAAVFLEGWLFFALSLFGLRQWLGRLMPRSLTLATGAGIGMYLAFIGLGPNGLGVVGGNAADLVGCECRLKT